MAEYYRVGKSSTQLLLRQGEIMNAYHCKKCNRPHFLGDAVRDMHRSYMVTGEALEKLYPSDVLVIHDEWVMDEDGVERPYKRLLGWLNLSSPEGHDPSWLPDPIPLPKFRPIPLDGTNHNPVLVEGNPYLLFFGSWRIGIARYVSVHDLWRFVRGGWSVDLKECEAVYEIEE